MTLELALALDAAAKQSAAGFPGEQLLANKTARAVEALKAARAAEGIKAIGSRGFKLRATTQMTAAVARGGGLDWWGMRGWSI
jgi:hypothetical protein